MRRSSQTATIDLRVTVPEPGTTLSGLGVRVYRNTKLLATRQVPKVGRIKVKDVPLRRGTNKLTATIANDGGEGPRSDDRDPHRRRPGAQDDGQDAPPDNTVLNARPASRVTGKTEAGLTVIGRNIDLG